LFANDVIAVENYLLPLAIWFLLLFLHILFHLSEHLKQLVFTLLWRLGGDRRLLQSGRGGTVRERLIVDSLGGRASDSRLVLSLEGHATDHSFAWAHAGQERGYLREVERERSWVWRVRSQWKYQKCMKNSQKEFINTSNC